MTSCSGIAKMLVYTELGQAPTSQARSRDTDDLRPSNLTARALRSVEHTRSKFGHGPCPVRRGLVAAVRCCGRKTRFFAVRAGFVTEQEEPEPCVGFNTTKGKTCFVLCFPIHHCRPKIAWRSVPGTDTPSYKLVHIYWQPTQIALRDRVCAVRPPRNMLDRDVKYMVFGIIDELIEGTAVGEVYSLSCMAVVV